MTKSSSAFLNTKTQSMCENTIQKRSVLNTTIAQKVAADSDLLGASSNTNPYINNDSIAVHL